MKKDLLDILICPACLPRETPLTISVAQEKGRDVISGYLTCGGCGQRYAIEQGIANLLPDPASTLSPAQARYMETAMVSSYLWSHYADLFGDPEANEAYSTWASAINNRGSASLALDVGCAVGRFTFELAGKSEFCVGLDRSAAFISAARKIASEGSLRFSLKIEGHLTENKVITIPNGWESANVEFIIGDALALPFPCECFSLLSSLNLLDKVPKPLLHLQEINRVARHSEAGLLFSDPFSWSLESAPEEAWLGGKEVEPYSGLGLNNVRSLLEGKGGTILPPWTIEQTGRIPWKIRNHRNHFEMIFSEFITASR